MTAEALLWMIGRPTLFVSASALTAAVMLGAAKIRAPRVHRAAWLMVLLPGWLLVPWTWQVQSTGPVTPAETLQAEVLKTFTLSNLAAAEDLPVIAPSAPIDWWQLAVAAWLVGMVAVIVIGSLRYWHFVRRLPRSGLAQRPEWQLELSRQLRALGFRRRIDLCVTNDLGPLLCFVPFRYAVLVPRGLWEALERGERSAILRHEIAHLVRGDLWWSLAIRVLALPQWFNPLVWLAVRRFDEAGEWACDDWVARGRRVRELTFARSLISAAAYAATNSPGALSAQGGRLSRRVRRLVSIRKEERMTRKLLVLAPLFAIVGVQLVRIEFVAADEFKVKTVEAITGKISTVRTLPPEYVIEPPDVLAINAVQLVPKAPYRIEPFDSLIVRVLGTLPDQPIADAFAVDVEGKIDFGPSYGRIEVASFTVDEAKEIIKRRLSEVVQDPEVSVSLASSAAPQQIVGEHLVAPDGRVNLGIYGTVYVAGMTIGEARNAIEQQLSEDLRNPRVTVDVLSHNSKKYYVILRGSGQGDHVAAVSLSGNDCVLDALAKIDSLPEDPTNKIWISRPSEHGDGPDTILPVRWDDIFSGKSTTTNYPLLPGDRLFVVGGQPAEFGGRQSKPTPTTATPSASGYYGELNVKAAQPATTYGTSPKPKSTPPSAEPSPSGSGGFGYAEGEGAGAER